jgi:4-hydroxybenzoyl-CoA thioesterase
VGRPYPEVFRDGIGFPTVKVEMEFLAPVRYGDRVDIEVTVERVGRSSVQVRYLGSVRGRPVFRARNVAVVVDMKTFRSTDVPAWLRERLEAAKEGPGPTTAA